MIFRGTLFYFGCHVKSRALGSSPIDVDQWLPTVMSIGDAVINTKRNLVLA